MQKRIKTIAIILTMIIAIVIATDNFFDLGIMRAITSYTDQEAPVINTDELLSSYLLNEDVELVVTCEDNIDDVCTVVIVGSFDTTTLGEHTVSLEATDKANNKSIFSYTYQVLEEFDGSMYIPLGYYDSIDELEGEDLKTGLNLIVSGHVEFPYTSDNTDVWDILREADEHPDSTESIVSFYTGLTIAKDCQDTTYPPASCEIEAYGETKIVEWNREHIWSKSRGDFSDASDLGAHTDAHHLVAAERVMNSIKNNRFYEDCHDGDDTNVVDREYGNYTCNTWEFEPRDEVKGDVARMIFYMAVRYDDDVLDLEVVNDPDEDSSLKLPVYGDIDDLLRWHIQDPVSEKEVLRNEVIYSYQENRNPFIDKPELIEMIWGTSNAYQVNEIIDIEPDIIKTRYSITWDYNQYIFILSDKSKFLKSN